MATGDFDTYYSDNPWENLDKNQRQWYDPELIRVWQQRGTFSQSVPVKINQLGVRAKTMSVTQLFDPHPNFNSIGLRSLWLGASNNVSVLRPQLRMISSPTATSGREWLQSNGWV